MKLFSGAGARVNHGRSARSKPSDPGTQVLRRDPVREVPDRAADAARASAAARQPVHRTEELRQTSRTAPPVRQVPRQTDGYTVPTQRPAPYQPTQRVSREPQRRTTGESTHRISPEFENDYLQNHPYYVTERNRNQQKKSKNKRRLITISSVLVALAALYLVAVYSNIPFIEKWRTVYIETAIMTRTHQWLATTFIPKSVVDKTRATIDQVEASQENLESDWQDSEPITTIVLPAITRPSTPDTAAVDGGTDLPPEEIPVEEVPFWADPNSDFCLTYSELDMESFGEYAAEHEEDMFDENGNLFIDEAGLNQKGTSIRTIHGDQVLALDTVHGITIARLEGSGSAGRYKGVLAIVKDPASVGIAVASRLGVVGQKIGSMASDNDAILAINASGFEDPDGKGNGGIVYGLLYAAGKRYTGTGGGNYKVVYFDYDNRLHVGTWKKTDDIRDGVEFKPALIVNGEQVISGSAGWGIQPRTAIGQMEDGTILMLVVDGRQTHSIGITVGETAEILLKYGAVQALNLDGGSSSIMYFNGRKITQPSGGDKENGRYLPDAFVVYADRKATDGLERP